MGNKLLAITGNIATGKSYVAEILRRDHDFAHVNADEIGHRVLREPPVRDAIREAFGDTALSRGEVDRRALGAIVFGDPKKLATLGDITHPRIIGIARAEVAALIEAGHRVLFEAAVLFEAGWDREFSTILLTVCHETEQIDRVMRRNACSMDEAITVIRSQIPQDEKLDRATYVIDTTHGPRAFKRTLELIVKDITG
ncbi:MAG TPA: dephospho-CoA kinase [bacterium]|nr:dephospho-CoA kinase [bacterium]